MNYQKSSNDVFFHELSHSNPKGETSSVYQVLEM